MKWLLMTAALIALAGCAGEPVEPTTPSDEFTTESKPIGDPGIDPYRPKGPAPLITIPAEPPPPQPRK